MCAGAGQEEMRRLGRIKPLDSDLIFKDQASLNAFLKLSVLTVEQASMHTFRCKHRVPTTFTFMTTG